ACAPGMPTADCTRTGSNDAVATAIEVSGGESAPQISLDQPYEASESVFADIEVGDGPVIGDLDQPGVVEMTLFSAETGETIIGTSYAEGTTPSRIGNWTTM